MEMITVHNQTFRVLVATTKEDHIAQNQPNIANSMTENHIVRTIYVAKPKGSRVYMISEFEEGYERFSIPHHIPFFTANEFANA